jgi:intracellular sulfur oxidation DsrE/DsrF family protein
MFAIKGTGMKFYCTLVVLICMTFGLAAQAETPQTGPVIEGFGPTFSVPEGSFNLEAGKPYKIVMDVGKGPDDPSELNRSIDSMARFINMHARNGIDPDDLEIAVVLHGSGARSALNAEAHQEGFMVENGTAALVKALGEKGVKFYLCGQTAGYYGYGLDDLLPEVTMAVSAMTAHIRLQTEGFQLIPF